MATLNDIIQDFDNDIGCLGEQQAKKKKMLKTVKVGVFTNKDSWLAITLRGNT